MKKLLTILAATLLLAGCSTAGTQDEGQTSNATIDVYTRDASSGTRAAFEEAIDLKDMTINVIEVSSNGDMATKVGTNENAIGYVSLTTDFDANNLKPLSFDGVDATVETTLDGTYTMSRPFTYVTRASGDFSSQDKEDLVLAFIDYLSNSYEGLLVVESAGGIVDLANAKPWAELKVNHPIVDQDNSDITIVTAGSTSVSKTLEAALSSFQPMAGNFQFATNQSGSSDGYKRTLGSEKDGANASDIGFASRPFKAEEVVTDGLANGIYCMDAVVAVVNKDNPLSNISKDNLKAVYEGQIETFQQLD